MICDDETIRYEPAIVNYELPRGDTLTMNFLVEEMVDPDADPDDPETEWQPLDMSGSTWRSHVRVNHENGAVFRELVVDATDQDVGVILVPFGETETVNPGIEYHYDVERTDTGDQTMSMVKGIITFDADVTQ